MEGFDTVRAVARQWHGKACAEVGGSETAAALLDGATRLTGIARQAVADDDPYLCGAEAILEPSVAAIFYKKSVADDVAAFYQAHEFGHHWLDSAAGACSGIEMDPSDPEERTPLGMRRVEEYGPRERRETQANVFAREFLLPSDTARRLFVDDRLTAEDIAARFGVPPGLVHQQLSYGLLIPDITAEAMPGDGCASAAPPLDETQRAAAEVEEGPVLLEAGPGTGKTRTLIARVAWLLGARKVAASSILALTFSNKAAEEMRERVAVAVPHAATAIWAGTFHAFGLEMLRKFGHLIGLPTAVKLVDPSDALLLLEENLPSLPLSHYLQLYEPALALRDILGAISRAKDELITPERYLKLGQDMLAVAANDDKRERAERAIEVASIYGAYEEILRRNRVVDFADLILKPIELMRDHDVALDWVRSQYTHVLVDEYQDVNRASGVLLKAIAGEGKNLWVVGDARQSIYRFRGASPVNIRQFEGDFPRHRRMALGVNYRSQVPIVALVEAFVPHMRTSAGGIPARWTAHRGEQSGQVMMEIATDRPAEAVGIAREITRQRANGVPYRDQAILCRSHTNLARFASLLEALSIPVLYLGDLFERPEVCDLLSLLSLACEPDRGGLLRVARFPEYSVPIEDVQAVLAFARERELDPLPALRHLDEVAMLTARGREALGRLAAHLEGVGSQTPPSAFLTSYVFSRSRYLDQYLADASIAGQQQRLALFQFLQFAFEHRAPSRARGDPKRHLLRWIRRLETFGDERQLRQLPSTASGIDAVRLMTVHASKGLEFGAVYLPALGTAMFPVSPQYNPCPPPVGMLTEAPAASHLEEEQCLFFVAISRARDLLCLSRAQRYGGAPRNASPLLLELARRLPRAPDGPPTWREAGPRDEAEPAVPYLSPTLTEHVAEDLDQYLCCPLSYLYQRVLGLSGARDDTAYLRFHRSVYAVLRWMGTLPPGASVDLADALDKLDEAWRTIGPADHPYSRLYLDAAEGIVERAIARRSSSAKVDVVWMIKRPHGVIRVRPDIVDLSDGQVVVQRLRTGRPPKKIDDGIYALYHEGARQAHGAVPRKVEAVFLTTDVARPVSMSDTVIKNRLENYDAAIAAITAGAFPPKPSDRNCPRCPQYFICPAVPGSSGTP